MEIDLFKNLRKRLAEKGEMAFERSFKELNDTRNILYVKSLDDGPDLAIGKYNIYFGLSNKFAGKSIGIEEFMNYPTTYNEFTNYDYLKNEYIKAYVDMRMNKLSRELLKMIGE